MDKPHSWRCPHCGGWSTPPEPKQDRVEAEVERVTAQLKEAGVWISSDGRVNERDIAQPLFDRSPGTLRNWRSSGAMPVRPRMIRGNATYNLRELVEYLLHESAR